MSTIWIMIIVASAGGYQGGMAIEKVGTYETRAECVNAGLTAGLSIEFAGTKSPQFFCVSSPNGLEYE